MNLFCPECSRTFEDEGLRTCPHDGNALFKVRDKPDPLIGTVIDERFEVLALIGEGGMGTVYRAVQLSVGREVAVKVLKQELTQKKVALERFHRESKLISQLNHPNIVKLIDFGEDRTLGILYLVMEFVPGINLGDLIDRGRLRIPVALEILSQCASALAESHAMGIIHRDLKPDNIIITLMADGGLQAKVLDFGIARALEVNTQLTATGMVCGTPSYMAPEQAQNQELDARADLYSMGVIFYEMLSGWPPFTGTNSLQIIIKHIQEMPPKLRELLPPTAIPEFLEDFTDQLLAKSPAGRPTDALSLKKQVTELRKQLNLELPEVHGDLKAAEQAWVLPKLPIGDVHESGPTGVLRRETGTDWNTEIYDSGEAKTQTSTQTPSPREAEKVKEGVSASVVMDDPVSTSALTQRRSRTPSTIREERPEALEPVKTQVPQKTAETPAVQHAPSNGLGVLSIVALGLIAVLAATTLILWKILPGDTVASVVEAPTEPKPVAAVQEPAPAPEPILPIQAVVDLAHARVDGGFRAAILELGTATKEPVPAKVVKPIRTVKEAEPKVVREPAVVKKAPPVKEKPEPKKEVRNPLTGLTSE